MKSKILKSVAALIAASVVGYLAQSDFGRDLLKALSDQSASVATSQVL